MTRPSINRQEVSEERFNPSCIGEPANDPAVRLAMCGEILAAMDALLYASKEQQPAAMNRLRALLGAAQETGE